MTIEGLDAKGHSGIPNGDSLISTCRCQKIGGGLEMNAAHGINMSSEHASAPTDIDVQQSARGIKRSSGNVVSSSVEIDAPDGLTVVLKGKGAGGMHEIPYFDCAVT